MSTMCTPGNVKQWPHSFMHSFIIPSVLAGLIISGETWVLNACQAEDRCERKPQGGEKRRQFCSCHCCCHWHCHCVNGFLPDSPVCITVSQLSCGDFLTLIAPLCCVHIAWHIGCWEKHVEQCNVMVLNRTLRDCGEITQVGRGEAGIKKKKPTTGIFNIVTLAPCSSVISTYIAYYCLNEQMEETWQMPFVYLAALCFCTKGL